MPTLTMTTFAGTPGVPGSDATHLTLAYNSATGIDLAGNIYIVENNGKFSDDPSGGSRIRKIAPSGAISTVYQTDLSVPLRKYAILDIAVRPEGAVVAQLWEKVGTTPANYKFHTAAILESGNVSIFVIEQQTASAGMVYWRDQIYMQQTTGGAGGGTVTMVFNYANSWNYFTTLVAFDPPGPVTSISKILNRTAPTADYLYGIVQSYDSVGFPAYIRRVSTTGVETQWPNIPGWATPNQWQDIKYSPSDDCFYLLGNNAAIGSAGSWGFWRCDMNGTLTLLHSNDITGQRVPGYLVLDQLGTAYFVFVDGGLAHSVQKISGLFPPRLPSLSVFKDSFGTRNEGLWEFTGPASVVSGALELGDSSINGSALTKPIDEASTNYYFFDHALAQVLSPGGGVYIQVSSLDTGNFVIIQIDPVGAIGDPDVDGNTAIVRAQYQIGLETDEGEIAGMSEYYKPDLHKWIRVERVPGAPGAGDFIEWTTSADGILWASFFSFPIASTDFLNSTAELVGAQFARVDNFNIPGTEPPIEYPDPPDEDGDWPLDPVPNPDAPAPELESGSATVLELIRQFSGATRAIVRLTSATSIEIVNPNHPLPTGMAQADAPSMYWRNKVTAQAGLATLSHQSNDLIQTASGDLGDDDVRVITSDWKMPNQLPVYGLRPAPVLRWNWRFSPGGCTAGVDFWFPVPLTIVRRA